MERFTGRPRLVGEECIEKGVCVWLLATTVLLLDDSEGNRIAEVSPSALNSSSYWSCAAWVLLGDKCVSFPCGLDEGSHEKQSTAVFQQSNTRF